MLDDLNKRLKYDIAHKASEVTREKVSGLKTGLPALDGKTGCGGLPKGRVTEIYGRQSDGKSSFALTLIRSAQKQGLRCVFVDAEHTLETTYAKALGVDLDALTILKLDLDEYGEKYIEAVETIINENLADLVIVDSVDALTPKEEMESEVLARTMGAKARMLTKFFRRIISALDLNQITLVLLNQTRVDFISGFEDTPGGKALKFYTSMRIQLRNISALKSGENIIGKKIKFKIVKNKVGNPFGEIDTTFIFGEGFSSETDLIETGLESSVLTKQGNTIFHGETKLGVGKNKARLFLEENPDIAKKIEKEL